jgi:hypothetical protein
MAPRRPHHAGFRDSATFDWSAHHGRAGWYSWMDRTRMIM